MTFSCATPERRCGISSQRHGRRALPRNRPKPLKTGLDTKNRWIGPCPWVPWTLHYALVSGFWRTLIRQAENTAREGAGIPRVGEGWVSEMTLLRQVQAAFPGERVLHQARPGWLAPQSLDIYLPDYNLGIEYQGAQHIKPVEYFGGAKAFEVQQERDARKLDICEQYGCTLVEVYPGYQLEQVVARVRSAIQDAGRGPTSAFK